MKYLKVILFTLILATVCGLLLVGINISTKSRIARYEQFVLYSSILEALDITYSRENIDKIFQGNITAKKIGERIFYYGPDGAVAFEIRGSGLWGPIYGLITLEGDLTATRRLIILHQEETPGLGGRIEESEFLAQFKGKSISPKIVLLPKGKAKASNELDAITGATGSSKALEKLLNENIQQALVLINGMEFQKRNPNH